MNLSNDKSGFYSALLFLIWPLLAVFTAFWNYRQSWSKNILWAFVAFYGFAFAIGPENQDSDIVRYVAKVEELHSVSMTPGKAVDYFIESGEIDILETVIAVTISRVTNNKSVVILVYGLIFGFFFSRNMWFVLERLEGKIRIITLLLFVCFFLIVPIWNMNGFRFWTASHVFIYGLLPYLCDGKKNGVIISISSIFVHFAFLVPVLVLLGYILAGNRLIIYFVFFVTTLFISQINLSSFNELVESYSPEIVQERTAGYRGENYVEAYREGEGKQQNWYVKWYGQALNWSVIGFFFILFWVRKKSFDENKGWLNLFCFTLLFYGVANLLASLPSGGRYLAVVNLCALALITLYVQNQKYDKLMKRYIIAAIPALLLYIVVSLRMGLYSMSATAVWGNPVIALFMNGDFISLNDVMKMIL